MVDGVHGTCSGLSVYEGRPYESGLSLHCPEDIQPTTREKPE